MPLQYQRRRTWVAVAVVVFVAVVAAVVVFLSAVPVVTVTEIDFSSVDNACGANGSSITPGFSVRATASAVVSVGVENTDSFLNCTIVSLQATTGGFSISNANLPLTVPPKGNATLTFTVHGPASGYSGILTVDVE